MSVIMIKTVFSIENFREGVVSTPLG